MQMQPLCNVRDNQQVLLSHECFCTCSCSGQATFFARSCYRAWMVTLAHWYTNSHGRCMTDCKQCCGTRHVCAGHQWNLKLALNQNCGGGWRAWYVMRRCHGRRKRMKHCWQFNCLLCLLSKLGPAFLGWVNSDAGNRKNFVVQIEIEDEPESSIQLV